MKMADRRADNKNANRGTAREAAAKSLQKYGAGRSVLIDRDGRIIGGNKIQFRASSAEGNQPESTRSQMMGADSTLSVGSSVEFDFSVSGDSISAMCKKILRFSAATTGSSVCDGKSSSIFCNVTRRDRMSSEERRGDIKIGSMQD
jgi:hypothetical protein